MRVILIILATALAATAAAAQQLPAPTPQQPTTQGMATRPQAPVGHRQPRMSDLPPDLARKEQSGLPAGPDPAADDHLNICRGC
jgi:hypothetical protein